MSLRSPSFRSSRRGAAAISALAVALALPLLLAALPGAVADDDSSGEPAAEAPPPTMPELLAALRGESRGLLDSEVRARELERQVMETDDLQLRAGRVFQLGRELLRAGKTEEAIAAFLDIRRFFDSESVRVSPSLQRQLTEQLAVAYLRLGEQDNCLQLLGGEACILPLSPAARHVNPRGSRAAIAELRRLLAETRDLGHLWLLNLAAMTLGEYPQGVPETLRIPEERFRPERGFPRFSNRAPSLGLDVVGTSGGSVVEDFDGDGLLDVMASAWSLEEPLRLFHNEGDGRFAERSEAAGLSGEVGGLNLVHADYDNDGDADVLVLRGAWLSTLGEHPNSLLRNDGDGTFTDVTREAGVLSFHPTQTAAWADFDRDGDLDLFIGNESDERREHPCELYRNRGDGTFEEAAAEVGLDVRGFVKGVAWGDTDNDGWPDLYLSRFNQPNLLLHNEATERTAEKAAGEGGRRFVDVTAKAGVAEPVRSFPTWFWDFDQDGCLDLMVASYSGFTTETLDLVVGDFLGVPGVARAVRDTAPRLYRNRCDGTFEDVTGEAGLLTVLLAMGSNFGDLDNDGFPDMYFGTGEPALSTLVPNRMFLNLGGERFEEVTFAGGFGHLQKGHGVSFADLDNDGDQDVHAVLGGAFSGDVARNALFVNPGSPGNRWVTLKLVGTASPRSAQGSRVRVVVRTAEGERTVHRQVTTGGSFGGNPLRCEIGLGPAQAIERVEITWTSGREQVVTGIEPEGFYRITEGRPEPERLALSRIDLAARPTPAAGHPPNHGHPDHDEHPTSPRRR